jgi:lysophospholipase L1-like esterase
MKKEKGAKPLAYLFLFFIFFSSAITIANNESIIFENATPPDFELKQGDRVVFLGNSLFENELQYGYLEFALTSRWPDRDITFRNLGWSGDTVFGEARSYYTTPPTPYDLMIQQLRDAKPTVVFIAYGANEAEGGEEGIESFNSGLRQLLEKIEEIGAESILLSPIPFLTTASSELATKRNKNLQLYSSAIAKVAADQDNIFLDIMNPMLDLAESMPLSEDGVHLNETGYYYLALLIEEKLGMSLRKWALQINSGDQQVETNLSAELLSSRLPIKVKVKEELLPLPLPTLPIPLETERILRVVGLKKGYYTLSINESQVITSSAKDWSEGIAIYQGAPYLQSRLLLDLIVQKNEMFFHQYRPQNRTYIIGFRSYEQGGHIKGLEDLGIIIDYLEGQIKDLRVPQSNVYQLTAIH